MSCDVSKSLEAARMAIPIFVFLIRATRITTRMIVRKGVITVTLLVEAPKTVIWSLIHGTEGYCCASPPVIYNARF